MMRFWFPVICLALLAGCVDDGWEPQKRDYEEVDPLPSVDWPPRECVEIGCLVDPEHPNAVKARELYGIERLTQGAGSALMDIDDSLLAIQVRRTVDDKRGNPPASDVYAYNFSSDELVAVDAGNWKFAARPYVADGRVAYMRSDSLERGLMLWDSRTGESTPIDTGLAPGEQIWGFDGQWVLFASRGNEDVEMDGYYALHVESGQKRFLERPPNSDLPKIHGDLSNLDLWNGSAYIMATNEANDTTVQHVWQINLASNESRIWEVRTHKLAGVIYGGDGYLALWASDQIYILHKDNGTVERLEAVPGRCLTGQIINGWFVGACFPDIDDRGPSKKGVYAMHLPTREVHKITDERFSGESPIATNGDIVVFSGAVPTSQAPALFHPEDGASSVDYYWYRLPDAPGT